MSLCGTCKHWGTGAFDSFDPFDEDGNREPQTGPWRACGRIPHASRDDGPENAAPETRAVTCDGSDFFSAIKTAEDFGCVLHERKDP